MNKNPIFIEYYSHLGCNCYKILNPWTKYSADVRVLCPVSEGIGRATVLAAQVLTEEMAKALGESLEEKE